MNTGKRPLKNIALAPFKLMHYRAALNSFGVYSNPFAELTRYITGVGTYPRNINVRTPIGSVQLHLFSMHDLRTVNEVFCRHDYPCIGDERVIVDFGSNIGISAAFFLTRNSHSRCYLFEPLPQNIERLRHNVERFASRAILNPIAVGIENGVCNFWL